jgi:hypothetical protein
MLYKIINTINKQNCDKLARKIMDKINAVSLVAVADMIFLSHRNLHLLGDPITAAMLRTVMKGTLYYDVRN